MHSTSGSSIPVTVVMSVFDKPRDVARSIESVLAQQGVDLEFIIVSDGASEEVDAVLESFRDRRIKIVRQRNQGLTKALINGCNLATTEFIARVDAGDEVLPNRLVQQAKALDSEEDVAFVSCWVTVVTDDGIPLYEVTQSSQELMRGIQAQQIDQFKSPVHASVMFRKSAYQQVGGYREQFYFTQDCDLWVRLIRVGKIEVIPAFLQKIIFSASGISGRNKEMQSQLVSLVVKANELRVHGRSDESLLAEAAKIRPSASSTESVETQSGDFAGNYFVASLLTKSNPEAALKYWRLVLKERPLHMPSRIKYVWSWFKAKLNG